MKQKNKVMLIITQNIPQVVKEGGVIIPAFSNKVEFSSETVQPVTAENVASLAIVALNHYMKVERLQSNTGFKLSKPLTMEMIVNGRSGTIDKLKFTMNAERLAKKLESAPELVAAVFTSLPNVGGLTANKALNFMTMGGKTLLADAVKQLDNAQLVETVETPKIAESVPAIVE